MRRLRTFGPGSGRRGLCRKSFAEEAQFGVEFLHIVVASNFRIDQNPVNP
jgi:hypothetical protein